MPKAIEDRQEGIESLKLNVNGHQAHYLKTGSGPPVVLIHGGASDSRDWTHTMLNLSHRYCLYAPDLPGFGQNERSDEGYYLSDFSDFLLEFIDTLQLEKPVLAGHSFGARVCLDVACFHRNRVNKLILIDASGLGKISALGNALFTTFRALRVLFRRRQPFPRFLAKEGEDYNWVGAEALQNLEVPTLLVWKRLDPYVPLSIAHRAKVLIPGSKLAVISGYGHAPHQQNKEAFNRLLLDFLRQD